MASASVSYTMRPDEAVRAARSLNAGAWRLAGVVPFIAFACGLVILLVEGWPDAAAGVVGLWAAGLALLLFGFLMPRLGAGLARRRYPDVFAGETVVTVDDAGLHGAKGEARSEIGWDGMTDFVEADGTLVLRRGRRAVAIIPTRAFAGEAGRAAFVAVLREHLPEGDLRNPRPPRVP